MKMKRRKENANNGDRWTLFMKKANVEVLRESCDQELSK
jgi:hypothetical protein